MKSMRLIISILAALGFLFFTVQLPIDYFDPRGISPSALTILLGLVGAFGLLSVVCFIRRSKFGRLGLITSLSLYSLILIVNGVHSYATDYILGPLVGIEMFLTAGGFAILASLIIFKIGEGQR